MKSLDAKFSLLKRLQRTYSFSKSTKEVLRMYQFHITTLSKYLSSHILYRKLIETLLTGAMMLSFEVLILLYVQKCFFDEINLTQSYFILKKKEVLINVSKLQKRRPALSFHSKNKNISHSLKQYRLVMSQRISISNHAI
jgi:hypothetical protein